MGRICFNINRDGIRQRCYCAEPMLPPMLPCTQYLQKRRQLNESIRKDLKFGPSIAPGSGNFDHRLTYELLPRLKEDLSGEKNARLDAGGGQQRRR